MRKKLADQYRFDYRPRRQETTHVCVYIYISRVVVETPFLLEVQIYPFHGTCLRVNCGLNVFTAPSR